MASGLSVRMKGGNGENSYSKNSTLQTLVQERMKPLIEAAVTDLFKAGVGARFGVADLGCASGPNALALVSAAVDAVDRLLQGKAAAAAGRCEELTLSLNDLPSNDFSTAMAGLPLLQQRRHALDVGDGVQMPRVFVSIVPGTFYGRLFPEKTLHLVCSSFSLHWLSKVPGEVQSGKLRNKESICAGNLCSQVVCTAYALQFMNDFTLFLESRAKEIISGGWLVISIKGRKCRDYLQSDDMRTWDHMSIILNKMSSQGVLDKDKLETFHLPLYEPSPEELREAVSAEGSFEVTQLELYMAMQGVNTNWTAQSAAKAMCAPHEEVLSLHFGAGVVGDFLEAAEEHIRGSHEPYMGAVLVAGLRRKC